MKFNTKNSYLIGLIVFLFLFAIYFERNVSHYDIDANDIKTFQGVIHKKQNKIEELIEFFEKQLQQKNLKELFSVDYSIYNDLYEDEGIAIFIYKNDELAFWTNNLILIPNLYNELNLEGKVVRFKNAWYVLEECKISDYRVLGLGLIKNDYSYENEFLVNEFQDDFKVSNKIEISTTSIDSNYNIYDKDGEYLFSLVHPYKIFYNSWFINLSGIFYFIGILLFLIFCKRVIRRYILNKFLFVTAMFFCVVLIRLIMLKFSIPGVLNYMEIFDPHLFAGSNWFPSLGDFLINSVFIFIIVYLIFNELQISLFKERLKSRKYLISFVLFIFLILFFALISSLLRSLIFNSSILFDAYKIFDLTIYSFLGFFIFAILITSYLLFAGKIVTEVSSLLSLKDFIIIFLTALTVIIVLLWIILRFIDYGLILFVLSSIFFLAFVRYKKSSFKYSFIVFLALLSAIYTTIFIHACSIQKEKEIRKVLVDKLSNERDQIAEMLLEEISKEILNDTLIQRLSRDPLNESLIEKKLQDKYFGGYLGKYEMRLNACGIDFDLLIDDTKEIFPCHDFFEEMILEKGVYIPGTEFYFLENLEGVESYLGVIKFDETFPISNETILYISLISKSADRLGYPELLLDKRAAKYKFLKGYSYGKYSNDELTTQSGEYSYPLINNYRLDKKGDYRFLNFDDYSHFYYKTDDQNTVVISKSIVSLLEGLISFSYLFVFFYFILSLVFFIINYPENIRNLNYTFKTRIKFSMVLILLLSLVFIGTGTIYYSLKQYEKKQYEFIKEKTESVLVELSHKLGSDEYLDKEIEEYLKTILKKFAHVFYTDINLYSGKGNLLASSRPEVFEKGLIGKKMNSEAYMQIASNKKMIFIHKERMGKMKYYSAYAPFYNNDNKLLAYLNLPYFTKQSEIKNEIYTLSIAIINIYALLIIIATTIAVFISNKLTAPLQIIQNKLREIGLNKTNEQINYSGQDEIGSLIKEYNRKVVELSKSADLLAKSERETAWREVSKQVAHEIKNSLTPMKLTIQHLKQTYKSDNSEDIKKANKFFNIIIEQIEHLSEIATEFSNFAKMPKAKLEKVNIVDKISNSTRLFANQDNVDFQLDVRCNQNVNVFADKEQLQRVFVNLIKNAIQAVPSGKKAIIKINVDCDVKYVQIQIEDNGVGIPDEMRSKLFTPNFTTKSGGMGLGLSIVKNVIENLKGEISFDTEVDKGSTFFIKIPVYY